MGWIHREKRYSIKDYRDGEIHFLRFLLREHADGKRQPCWSIWKRSGF